MDESRLGFRVSGALRARIDRVGDTSAAARALIILGLHAAGADVTAFAEDAAADLRKLADPDVKDLFARAMFNKGLTDVQPSLNILAPSTDTAAPSVDASLGGVEASTDADPYADVGIDV